MGFGFGRNWTDLLLDAQKDLDAVLWQMARGDLLKHSISYALIRARKIVRGLSQSLTQDERSAVAQAAVDELRRHGDQWKLDEELPKGEVHTTPKGY